MFSSINPNNLAGLGKGLATILTAKFGACQFLHYGLSGDDTQNRDLQGRQLEFAKELVHSVKSSFEPNASVLLDGPSFGFVAQNLADADYQVCWLHRGSREIKSDVIHQNLTIGDQQLCDFNSAVKFQIIVMEGSYHYLEQLKLLSKSRDFLVEGGLAIIFGEYLDDDSARKYATLPNLSSMRQLSERLGFDVLKETDFTRDAISTIEDFQKICDEENFSLTVFKNFQETTNLLNLIKSELATSRRCYKIFHLRKSARLTDEYARAEYGDIDSFDPVEISELFEKSFNTEFNLDIWNWKYSLGGGKCVVARSGKEGAIVSHYGGAPREIQYFGESNVAIQPCDVMVLPEVRLHYGKGSLFFKTAATFLEREIGNTVNHLLGFGFPNKKAMNIALRLGLYEKTDDFIELIYPQRSPQHIGSYSLTPIEITNEAHRSVIDDLWQSMATAFNSGIVGNRDARYINYRYFDHPYGKSGLFKRFFIVDGGGEICAAVFMKEHEKCLLLMDIICPVPDMPERVRQLTGLIGEEKLKIWITKAWIDEVRISGVIENELGIEIPCNSWNPGPSSKVLYGAWWLTAGDMDFM